MTHSLAYILTLLVAGIALIVILSTRYKIPAFFSLFLACVLVGLGVGMPVADVLGTVKDGFGNILKNLGLIIVLGTTLGLLLEYTGSTTVMANFLLKRMGKRFAPLAMSITGFFVGLPIFCDSGYIVLIGLNRSMAKRTGISIATMSVSLATGLLSVHCMVPPHPGASAAAATIGVNFGKLILIGAIASIPAMLIGNWWANYAGRNACDKIVEDIDEDESGHGPSLFKACLPVFVPIILIAIRSFLTKGIANDPAWVKVLFALGDPVIALLIGVLLALNCKRGWHKSELSKILQDSVEKAGGILVVIGMGGAFGAILTATKLGDHLSQSMALGTMGLFFPFLLTAVLKTAQGSSTVAIITASSLVLPLLPALGLDTENGKLFCVLAMGAGSMTVSHANDAYFWVISRFSGISMKTMLKVYTVSTLFMGIITLATVYILSKIW
ncbi:MAG: GntP family permease [Bacteroidetes bacterium]|jgi:GntP family gluconate:H+ symporter|nr:GntP family permease [Bacteroidota bacterium]